MTLTLLGPVVCTWKAAAPRRLVLISGSAGPALRHGSREHDFDPQSNIRERHRRQHPARERRLPVVRAADARLAEQQHLPQPPYLPLSAMYASAES